MAFSDDLLKQARHLALKEPKKPVQASLKRSVSDSYYAVFHLLTEDTSKMLVGGSKNPQLRFLTQRAFDHGSMNRAAKTFHASGLPARLQPLIERPLSSDLRYVAQAFSDLQEQRHEADYNPSARFTRKEALNWHNVAQEAFRKWRNIKKSDEGQVFMVSLLLWEKWKR